jgi:hypothetical protein
MAHIEDNGLVDDDDQHVHPWQPNNPPHIASSTSDQPSSSHPFNEVRKIQAYKNSQYITHNIPMDNIIKFSSI